MTADEIKVLEKIFDTKLDPLGKQLDRVEKRVEKVEERLDTMEEKLAEFKTNTENTLLVITERLNQTADKEDVQALEQRVAVLEHHHNN
jgi:F0F1-type ATP synthase membrane subunit b/b'